MKIIVFALVCAVGVIAAVKVVGCAADKYIKIKAERDIGRWVQEFRVNEGEAKNEHLQ